MSSKEGRVKISAVTKMVIHGSKMTKNKTFQIQILLEQKLFCGVKSERHDKRPLSNLSSRLALALSKAHMQLWFVGLCARPCSPVPRSFEGWVLCLAASEQPCANHCQRPSYRRIPEAICLPPSLTHIQREMWCGLDTGPVKLSS